jgi:signal transduction histidine kinase
MFNKEGIPFFTMFIPFFVIIFITFFTTSYYLKISDERFKKEVIEIKTYTLKVENVEVIENLIKEKTKTHREEQEDFKSFIIILTVILLAFMSLFFLLMYSIISDVIKKYKKQVQHREKSLERLNKTLSVKVKRGIEEAKKKDKAILHQAKLARLGSMIAMIAHQWRQPLTELSGTLMELETATRFKKVNDEHILNSLGKSDKLISFMSNTIDDFRNFYKPDKKKEYFLTEKSCQKAIGLIDASLQSVSINLTIDVKDDREILGYEREFSQVILNLISNARDILIEKNIEEPRINLNIENSSHLQIIEVSDNAGGIKEENFDLIFDPYFSTKDVKGTGLGLYIAKLIIERNMGGELSVHNDEHGAVFRIVLAG